MEDYQQGAKSKLALPNYDSDIPSHSLASHLDVPSVATNLCSLGDSRPPVPCQISDECVVLISQLSYPDTAHHPSLSSIARTGRVEPLASSPFTPTIIVIIGILGSK